MVSLLPLVNCYWWVLLPMFRGSTVPRPPSRSLQPALRFFPSFFFLGNFKEQKADVAHFPATFKCFSSLCNVRRKAFQLEFIVQSREEAAVVGA